MNKTMFSWVPGFVKNPSTRFLRTLLTLRGWLLLIAVVYLLIVVVPDESDIVAAVFGYSVVGLFLFALLITVFQGRAIRRNLSVQVAAEPRQARDGGLGNLRSGETAIVVMRTTRLRLFPLFSLNLKLEFEHPGLSPAEHVIIGRSDEARTLMDEVVFPHRGEWTVRALHCSYGDYLGLFSYAWDIPGSDVLGSFRVHPPFFHSTSLPVLSSAVKSGDTVVDLHERRGDPFDLKPYHPSDGLRKILWKLYAKRGELISRHPEKAMTPEGKVVVFACAGREDDQLCGQLLAYLRNLEALDLELFIGCEGMGQDAPARSSQAAEDLLIETVWGVNQSGTAGAFRELEGMLENMNAFAQEVQLHSLLVFCSEQRFTERSVRDFMLQVGDALQRKGIQPIFCVTQGAAQLPDSNGLMGISSKLMDWLFYPIPGAIQKFPRFYREFAQTCAAKGWEVLSAR